MDKTIKLKEAIKFALAFVLVYGIALKINWFSPGWAAWSVVAISATSGGGESLQKGLLRIWGTLLACLVGISIISIAAQNRWLFMLLTAGWLFFCTYKMLANKEKSYFWFVAGYVTLVITAAGASSVGGFYIAVFRTAETIMGIVVYTLVAIFIWPQTNIGAIINAVCNLLNTQTELINDVYNVLNGTISINSLKVLAQLQVKQLDEFKASLNAEGSESYEVKELKHLWDQYQYLNNSLIKSFDRLLRGIEDVSIINKELNRPNVNSYFNEIERRFKVMSDLFSGKTTSFSFENIKLKISNITRQDISNFDKAALTIVITELNTIDQISQEMVQVALNLSGINAQPQQATNKILNSQRKPKFKFPVLDVEYLKASFYVFSTIVVGFVIWFYVNPPGHGNLYIYGGVFALIFAGAQQIKPIKLIFPFLIAMIVASTIYLFVLPSITMFYQLGILLFLCIFIIKYYLPSAAATVFIIVFIQLIAINNPQTYDIVALLNSFVFVVILMFYLFGMSYLISSPRPEKALLKLVSRFFISAKYLIDSQGLKTSSLTAFQNYKTAFYLNEMQNLPDKISAWGKAIDKNLFPNTDSNQIEQMVSAMKVIVIRMETLIATNNVDQEEMLPILNDTIEGLRLRLSNVFDNWDNIEEEDIKNNISQLVLNRMEELEEKLKNILSDNEHQIKEAEGIQFFQLLGGFRGVTEATLSFAKSADKLDWKQWKEERFQ